jgi:ubiquinone/menaquinone biosynthesis C-methylase UbiE
MKEGQRFLDPEKLLKSVPVVPGMVIADFGCGNGYYSVACGKLVGNKGKVFALDIMGDALSQTATLARMTNVYNVTTKICDLEKLGACGIDDISCDLVIISSIMHQAEKKENIIREAYRVLKTGGRVLLVEWKESSPFGPPAPDRVPEKEARGILEKSGFRPKAELQAGSFHYAITYQK